MNPVSTGQKVPNFISVKATGTLGIRPLLYIFHFITRLFIITFVCQSTHDH
jgi:hypothetical protein